MKKTAQIIYTTLLLGAASLSAKAQDIHLSQFYQVATLRNPALTGIFTGDYKVGVIYRNQWSSISAPFQTAVISAETRIPVSDEVNDFFSIGLVAYYDKAGSINLQTLSVCPTISYNKSLEDAHRSFLSVGFTGGYVQRSFDPAKMTFDEQYQNGSFNSSNPNGENLPDPKQTQWDLGAGICFSSTAGQDDKITYFIGESAYHLTRPKDAYYSDQASLRTQVRWNTNLGLGWKLDETWKAQFQGNYMLQGPYNEIVAGGLLAWNKMDNSTEQPEMTLAAGLFYRVNDAIIPTLKVNYHDLDITASYDLNSSSLKAATNLRGGFEISVFKNGLFRDPRFEKSRTICPKAW
ncbi:PorP/SprF family type IX secretion system membrane protein [Chitinophagaceae bacterium MMS25-I14]